MIGHGFDTMRRARGRRADAFGRTAETQAAEALGRAGWQVLARRLRMAGGEIDLVAERDGVTAMIEVKARPSLAEAAYAVQPRQQRRMISAATSALAMNPGWGRNGVRFDVVVVDRIGQGRRIADAFRAEAA